MRWAGPKRLGGLVALVGVLACSQPAPRRVRRDLAPPVQSGWARVVLDASAQRDSRGLWISDAEGRSVPFLRGREGLWAPQPLELRHLNLGTDNQGRPTADFELQLPAGWEVGERARLRLDLDLQGQAPWVATVVAARQRAGGEFLAYEAADHVYDLSPSGHRTSLRLPWDGDRYRLSLRPEQGRVPRILGLRAWAETPPEAISPHLQEDAALAPVAGRPGSWRVSLGAPDRITGLEVVLAPPAAPLRVEVCPAQGEGGPLASALLWNLPALGSRATRADLPPTLAQDLLLRLPEGAQPVSVKVRLHREALLFPAEKGVAYCLHLGGEAKPAPGDLGALPSSRLLLAAEPLGLGPERPDPDGLPRRVDAAARSRPWIPWVAGLAILGLGVVAWRLLREGRDPV